jgi:chromosomal replication initiation ATPase DnaA
MDHLGSLLTTGLAILSIATLAGLGLTRGLVINLRESLADARAEIADKDRRASEAQAESDRRLGDAEAEIAKVKAQNAVQANDLIALGRVVTGEAHWVAIGHKLDEHHDEAKIHWANDEETMRKMLTALEKLTVPEKPR